MTTLVAPTDITDLGFNQNQFSVATPAAFTTYVQAVINDAESELIEACGGDANFATLTADAKKKSFLTRAEKYLVSAELWSRRLIALDGQSMTARDDRATFMLQNQATKNAQTAEERAWQYIELATGTTRGEGEPQSGYIETGPLDAATV